MRRLRIGASGVGYEPKFVNDHRNACTVTLPVIRQPIRQGHALDVRLCPTDSEGYTVQFTVIVAHARAMFKIQRCWRLYELLRRASNSPDLLIRHASSIGYS
jgi:hypothetical protein